MICNEKNYFYIGLNRQNFFFEMVHAAETANTGTLQGVMDAAKRIHCSYLNVYAVDVIKSTLGNKNYNPRWEQAMKNGYKYFQKKNNELLGK